MCGFRFFFLLSLLNLCAKNISFEFYGSRFFLVCDGGDSGKTENNLEETRKKTGW